MLPSPCSRNRRQNSQRGASHEPAERPQLAVDCLAELECLAQKIRRGTTLRLSVRACVNTFISATELLQNLSENLQ